MNSLLHPLPLVFLLAAGSPLTAGEQAVVRTTLPTAATTGTFELPGRTEPVEAATIFTRATGIVGERKFDIGDRVKAGETLAIIAVPEIDRSIETARAVVDRAAAKAKIDREDALRSANLSATKAVPLEQSEERAAIAAQSEADRRAAEAELARLMELQKFATVTAPFDGTIAARNFDRGDRMRGDSSTPEGWLYRLVRLDKLRFVVSATPDLALRISKDAVANVRFNELPGRVFEAGFSRSSKVFDTDSGTMRTEFMLENPDLQLPAGLTGTASLKLPPAPGTFILPTNTIVMRKGISAVAAVIDGKVSFIDVLVGKNFGSTVEMTSAKLSPSTAVIINPNALLREGDPVQATAAPPAK